ncbi:lipocalin family protein [Microbacterium sp. B2969]|uniref:Lipocalin family protein n=1 Tax=Microbacterium alkaliflavum TaxID=3248839 RepID=A0ABW7Q6J3_9MICO
MNTSRIGLAVGALMLALMLPACAPGIPRTDPPGPSPAETGDGPTTQPVAPPILQPLDPALVGEWRVSSWLDSTGSQALWEIYRFTADGHYRYTFSECRSTTECALISQEQGTAQTAGGVLTLVPQTASDVGTQEWPYEVGFLDPEITVSLELHLLNADGSVHQIFYGDA